MNRIILYYQTFTSLKPILRKPVYVTHIHVSSIHFGTNPDRDDYAFVPNINQEHEDSEKKRRVIKTKWTPIFITIPVKSGKKMTFAVKQAPKGKPNLL